MEKSRGRIEKRTLRTTSILTVGPSWAGLEQGFEITRERTVRGKTTVEVVYGITSLSPEEATAANLLSILRNHWRIENELHYVRDVTLCEDACRVRRGSAPQVLAAVRNSVIHLVSDFPSENCQDAIEQLQIDRNKALKLIGLPPM